MSKRIESACAIPSSLHQEPATPELSSGDVSQLLAELPPRISDVISKWAEIAPGHLALVEGSIAWTYSQLEAAERDTRHWLIQIGIRPGDRVMVVCENCRALVALLLASAALDAWPALVNARLSAGEVDTIRDHSGARRVIYTAGTSQHAREHAKRHGASILKDPALGTLALGNLNDAAQPEPLDSDIESRVGALIYTSGSTGSPKGVMLTHRNLLFLAAISAKIRSLAPNDRMYGILPMSHAVGLSVVLLGTLFSGAALYLTPRFDPVAMLAALQKDGITVVLGAPSMFSLFLEYARLKRLTAPKFSSLRIIASASAPLDLALKTEVEKLFGLVLHNGYGVTECSPTIAQTRPGSPRSDVSVGPVFPGVQIKIVDSNHNRVADGQVGELWVRGPNVMKGYYRAPEETAAVIDSEGWFNTRDLARIENGNLFIVGRTKELIVRFGFNVYPAEVETALNSHPAVLRSAVVGRSVEATEGGEEIIAFVELAPGSLASSGELAEYASHKLAPYKRPSQILIVSDMPMTPTGKIAKSDLTRIVALAPPKG